MDCKTGRLISWFAVFTNSVENVASSRETWSVQMFQKCKQYTLVWIGFHLLFECMGRNAITRYQGESTSLWWKRVKPMQTIWDLWEERQSTRCEIAAPGFSLEIWVLLGEGMLGLNRRESVNLDNCRGVWREAGSCWSKTQGRGFRFVICRWDTLCNTTTSSAAAENKVDREDLKTS